MEGERRGARYRAARSAPSEKEASPPNKPGNLLFPLSRAGRGILHRVSLPIQARDPVGYNRAFLDSYVPNRSFFLSKRERSHLHAAGQTDLPDEPAGTYAKRILQRLLIDLSFHSSRLEGNTYSLLDTKRLLELGQVAQGKSNQDTQMILNHKEAIDFLVSGAEEIGFNRHTILGLHALLSNNLLGDPSASGRLRSIPVAIGGSVFRPLEIPALIHEVFDQVLHSANLIEDPFEQSFFALVHIPYLQPFEDVNKRVSRLAANIPMIRRNLRPLSFVDVPDFIYTSGILGVYELNRVELLRDVFVWAYERSAREYVAVRQSLGEPDPFKLRHRDAIRQVVTEVVQQRMDKQAAVAYVRAWATENMSPEHRARFSDAVEGELIGLHSGNFVRFRIRPSEFDAWKQVWNNGP